MNSGIRQTTTAVTDRLHEVWAGIGQALASPRRVQLLDILAQGPRPVEALARATGLTVTNTSAHLHVLKAARLVESRKRAQFVHYRLAGDGVLRVLREVRALAREQVHEVEHLARLYFDGRDAFEPVGADELRRRLKAGDVTLIDVRPELEYRAGHIPGALSIPLHQLDRRLRAIPRDRLVVAYCRGPYCVLTIEAIERLRRKGYEARRFPEGLPGWRADGRPVEVLLA